MKVRWSAQARRDLREIVRIIWQDNPAASRRMYALLIGAGDRLGERPFMGRPGSIPDTRELIPHPSYRIVYVVGDRELRIVTIFHTSRQWPPVTEDQS